MKTTAETESRPAAADVEQERVLALDLVRAGLPLNARELALVMRDGISRFHKKAKLGVYDPFLLKPATGPRRYSGAKVARWLEGEIVDDRPERVFGRKRGQGWAR